jgi:hypothetical protein
VDGVGNLYFTDNLGNVNRQTVKSGGGYNQPVIVGSSATGAFMAVDPSGNPYFFQASGTGLYGNQTYLVAEESLSQPPTLNFATTAGGSVSSDSPQTVTITNVGNSALNFSEIRYPRDFQPGPRVPNTCTFAKTLERGQSCNLPIQFKPNAAGQLSEAVVVTTNSLNQSGNQQRISVNGTGTAPSYDSQIQVLLSASTITFPGSTIVAVQIDPGSNPTHHPTGTAQLILDGNALPVTLNLSGAGHGYAAAYYDLAGVAAGLHSLYAVYSGDASNPAGNSSPISLDVLASPVNLDVSCQNPTLAYGANYKCEGYTGPVAAGINTAIAYQYDNAAPVSVPLSGGAASFSIPAPAIGPQTVAISYAAQGNYAAAAPVTESFTVVAP